MLYIYVLQQEHLIILFPPSAQEWKVNAVQFSVNVWSSQVKSQAEERLIDY